jgi:hypothetical protein
MRVRIDESWRDYQARPVDDPFGAIAYRPKFDDSSLRDRNIRLVTGGAGPIHHRAAANNQV